MSGGRVELGLGSGWFEKEHHAYGIPFPPLRERFDRLTEQLAIVTGLWTTPPGETFDHTGQYYTIAGSPALAARWAAEFNVPFAPLDVARAQYRRVSAAGRPADSVVYSSAFVLCAGRDDAEVARAATARWSARPARSPTTWAPGATSACGASTTQMLDLTDLDHLECVAS